MLVTCGVLLLACTERDTFGSPDETGSPGSSTSTTLRVDRPDDTVDATAPIDVTSPVEESVVEQPEVNATASVQIEGDRYEIDVLATDCSFDLDGVWDVNGTTVVDGTTVGFSASYELVPGVDGADDTWALLVYLSFDLGDQGAYQHLHDTAAEAASGVGTAAPQQRRPRIDAAPGRLVVRAEFVDPTGTLLDAGDTTPGRVDVTCS